MPVAVQASISCAYAQVLFHEGSQAKEKAWLKTNGGAANASVLGRTAFIRCIMRHSADMAFHDLAATC